MSTHVIKQVFYVLKEIVVDGESCIEEEIKNVGNLVFSWSLFTNYVHLLVETRCTGVKGVY